MKVTAVANWFGSNRMLAENVGRLLKGCSWVGVPFAGGMCELAHIDANVMLVSDLHRHVINLARCVKNYRDDLAASLDLMAFHPDELAAAQRRCSVREASELQLLDGGALQWAVDYFVASWMARAGSAGTEDEFSGVMSIRWKAGGGDSAVRFRSAIESLRDWHEIMRRCTFVCLDVFEFLGQCRKRDIRENGIYLDPPFPGPGDGYKHKFSIADHRRMAADLLAFENVRIVCRFYDVELIRDLYSESLWKWHRFDGRKQTNDSAPEVLLERIRK